MQMESFKSFLYFVISYDRTFVHSQSFCSTCIHIYTEAINGAVCQEYNSRHIVITQKILSMGSWCVLRVLETVWPCFPPFAAIVGTLPPITGLAWLLGDPIMRVRHRQGPLPTDVFSNCLVARHSKHNQGSGDKLCMKMIGFLVKDLQNTVRRHRLCSNTLHSQMQSFFVLLLTNQIAIKLC